VQKLVSKVPEGHGAQVVVAMSSQEETQRTTELHGGGVVTGTVGGGSPQLLQLPAETSRMMIKAMITSSA